MPASRSFLLTVAACLAAPCVQAALLYAFPAAKTFELKLCAGAPSAP